MNPSALLENVIEGGQMMFVHTADNGVIILQRNSNLAHGVGTAIKALTFFPAALVDSPKLFLVCEKCGKNFGGNHRFLERRKIWQRAVREGTIVGRMAPPAQVPVYDPSARSAKG